MVAVESLTGNYVAHKSSEITSWPKQYHVIYKILQVSKFYYIAFTFKTYN